jgi:hypothetical protein
VSPVLESRLQPAKAGTPTPGSRSARVSAFGAGLLTPLQRLMDSPVQSRKRFPVTRPQDLFLFHRTTSMRNGLRARGFAGG